MSYNITLYEKTTNLTDVFKSGTTPGTSGFKIITTDFNSIFAAYTGGYKQFFTQEFLGNTTTFPSFLFTKLLVPINTSYDMKSSFFYTATGNDTTFTTVPSGYNYGIRFNGTGTITFKTDTVANVWLVAGGGEVGKIMVPRQEALVEVEQAL